MTTSRKFKNFSVVQWRDVDEWKFVYTSIYDANTTLEYKRDALRILKQWQKRNCLLPSGVEGTLCILQGLLVDDSKLSENEYCMLAGACIVRFMNICVTNEVTDMSFTAIARKFAIPIWIIKVRHEFSHRQRMPSRVVIDAALRTCLEWLQQAYWLKEIPNMENFEINPRKNVNDLPELIGIFCNMFVYVHRNMEFDDFLLFRRRSLTCELEKQENQRTDMSYILNHIKSMISSADPLTWQLVINDMLFSRWFLVHPNEIEDNVWCLEYMKELLKLVEAENELHTLVHGMHNLLLDDNNENGELIAVWLNEIFSDANQPAAIQHLLELKREFIARQNAFTKTFFHSFMKLENPLITEKEAEFLLKKPSVVDFDLFDELRDNLSCNNIKQPMENVINEKEMNQECRKKRKWTLELDTALFESCPLGVVPF